MSVYRRSVTNCVSFPYVVYFCLFSPLKDRYAFNICLQLLGLRPQTPTRALPLDCAGGFRPPPSGVFKGGGLCEAPPFGRTAVIFVTILGLFLAPYRDKIAATSDQMRFFGWKML